MDEQSVVFIYDGMLLNLKKERNSDTCSNIGEPWRHYAKWNKPGTKGKILYDSAYMRDLEQSSS